MFYFYHKTFWACRSRFLRFSENSFVIYFLFNLQYSSIMELYVFWFGLHQLVIIYITTSQPHKKQGDHIRDSPDSLISERHSSLSVSHPRIPSVHVYSCVVRCDICFNIYHLSSYNNSSLHFFWRMQSTILESNRDGGNPSGFDTKNVAPYWTEQK